MGMPTQAEYIERRRGGRIASIWTQIHDTEADLWVALFEMRESEEVARLKDKLKELRQVRDDYYQAKNEARSQVIQN